MVPSSVRPFIVGKQGANLKNITTLTGTTINIPKFDGTEDADDAEIVITITGNLDAIEEAKQEIDAIVAERVLIAHLD